MSDVVLFEELKTSNGYIGRATLNRPQKLNTLTTEMIALLHRQFAAWAEDDACKTVFLDGAGDKGFCAGGDVVAVTTDPSPEMAVGRTFFSTEYDLNYFMHTFPKPLLVWGGGICMGGGFGLLWFGRGVKWCVFESFWGDYVFSEGSASDRRKA